jgi:predicted heme/steroid binding protein
MSTIRKNGKSYDSGDVVVTIDGTVYDEVKEITYNTDQEHQVNHSLANDATSWGMGKITHKASITLYMAAWVAIESKLGSNILKARPFDIQVTYVDSYNTIINDTITAKFQSQGRDVTGDIGLSKQVDLFVLGIQYQS